MHDLQIQLKYEFENSAILEQALTHRSYAVNNNERLEFLGDAILDFIIGDELYRRHPVCKEGELSQMRALIVCGESLSVIGSALQLGALLRLGQGEDRSGGRERVSNLANAVEALIAAVYLDGGMDACRGVVEHLFARSIEASNSLALKDAKTRLQEFLQSRQMPLPVYTLLSRTGKDHAAHFRILCDVASLKLCAEADATSVKKAEQAAATKILFIIEKGSV